MELYCISLGVYKCSVLRQWMLISTMWKLEWPLKVSTIAMFFGCLRWKLTEIFFMWFRPSCLRTHNINNVTRTLSLISVSVHCINSTHHFDVRVIKICVIDQTWGHRDEVTETEKKRTRLISSQLDRTRMVNKGIIVQQKYLFIKIKNILSISRAGSK